MTSDIPGRGDKPVSSAVAAIQSSLAAVADGAEALRADVKASEEARRRSSNINLGLTVVLVVLVGLVLAIGWQNNRLNQRVAEGNALLVDCTTTGGKCYQQGQARGDSAVSAVVRISVFVSQCGRLWPGESGPEFDRKLNACVAERLAQAASPPPATPAPPGPRPSADPSASPSG